jgi:Mg/Co/Ni transporter MgtE
MSQDLSTLSFQDLTERLASYLSISATAQSLTELDLEQRILALQILGESLAAMVLDYLPQAEQVELLQGMEATELIGVLEAMEPKSRHYLFSNLPPEVTEQLIAKLNQEFEMTLHGLLTELITQPIPTDPSDRIDSIDQTYCRCLDGWEIDSCGN